MATENNNLALSGDWTCACHLTRGGQGSLVLIRQQRGSIDTYTLPSAEASGIEEPRRPQLVGVAGDGVLLLNPMDLGIAAHTALPLDAVPTYAYGDADTQTYWMVSDGDKDSGADPLNCDNGGSPVTVVDSAGRDAPVAALRRICAGRGHHVVAYTRPSAAWPQMPRRAYASNLLEGTITVIGNDPALPDIYLKVITTINLCDATHEDGLAERVPNNAFPHGMGYSPHTGKLYNLNNGYGTVAVIDPLKNTLEKTYKMPVSSNLLLSPDGRFLIGKGVDRKADPEHLIGRLTVMNAATGRSTTLDLKDVYPSVYRFDATGDKLYVTTAATGKGVQKQNAKLDTVLVFDTSSLPDIRLLGEIEVGKADCGRRPLAFYERDGATRLVFVPNPSDATLSIVDGATDRVIETVALAAEPADEVNFMYWRSGLHGA